MNWRFIIVLAVSFFVLGYAFWKYDNHVTQMEQLWEQQLNQPTLPGESPLTDGYENRGQYGDSFGYMNALFAFLSMILVVGTLFLQTYELSLQRRDLKASRRDISRQVKADETIAKNQEYANMLEFRKQFSQALLALREKAKDIPFKVRKGIKDEELEELKSLHLIKLRMVLQEFRDFNMILQLRVIYGSLKKETKVTDYFNPIPTYET